MCYVNKANVNLHSRTCKMLKNLLNNEKMYVFSPNEVIVENTFLVVNISLIKPQKSIMLINLTVYKYFKRCAAWRGFFYIIIMLWINRLKIAIFNKL